MKQPRADEEESAPCSSSAEAQGGHSESHMLSPALAAVWSKLEASLLFKAAVIAAYVGLNISLNILNKWTLSSYGFHFPLLMAMAHMLFSFTALGPLMLMPAFRDLHAPTLSKQWLGLLLISTLFTMNVGLNNVSLVSIPLSLNQVIRAAIPLFATIGSIFIESKTPSLREVLSLVVLCAGVGMAVWEGSDSSASAWGITICVLGTVSSGCMMSCMGRLLTQRVDVLRMAFYTAPLACVTLAPFFYSLEAQGFAKYQRTHSSGYSSLLLLGCVNALAYNLIHSYVIKITSAVTTTVIGDMKIILILLLSSLLLGESDIWTLKMVIGCTTTVVGFCMYSHARLVASASSGPSAGEPVAIIKGAAEHEAGSALEMAHAVQERTPLLAKELLGGAPRGAQRAGA